ncbi:transposon-encoded TnpW family protein [Clostridia bacterium OttesenSCG-928-F22]|nr:transposon-encoded TnpW family protein [Clostridia bacterium OttesenSCG-928-F22]
MKVIGKKTYIVESFFDEASKQTLEKKIYRLIDRDLTLLSNKSELTSQEP